jgi:hypothetical protein
MITPVSGTAQLLSSVRPAAATQASSSAKPRAAPADTVTIGGVANAMQEALETSVQTIKEAAAGDLQAVHLLARETAAAKAA